MLKIKNKITNPMTVIAIFAGISEASAAISLPFLNSEDRAIYVWFLISFPFYLLFLFFITLNFNYRSLYSPSDFGKDATFLKAMDSNDRDNKRNTSKEGSTTHHTFGISSRVVPHDTAAQCADSCEIHNAPDPPTPPRTRSNLTVQHNIQLPVCVSNLHIIDARDIDASRELATIVQRIRLNDRKATRVIVFLSNHVSDASLTKSALLQIKHARKDSGTTLCIVYNLCSQAVTLLGRT
ncbi:hypothetical protein PHLH6_46200 [Pseudomonas sp. Seg1]|uniref:hypothetical protein n=1 Tax=Pseudomonas sp. Seg1 TaxID=2678259 RepID=UPI001BB3A6DA|nr:hypothetical protein [Pseudomonas sp. Seg1]BBP72616.1 hypothetical protein PHLH6_46200 [Pseudomonas sp. Seg1]